MAEYKPKNDLPKKQVHLYVYKDTERIIKAFGYNSSEFFTLSALKLLNTGLDKEYNTVKSEIEKKEKEKKRLMEDLKNCNDDLSKLKEQLKDMKALINDFDVNESNVDSAIREIMKLGRERAESEERKPYIYFDDVIPICAKYNINNYMFILSKIPKNFLESHFKLRFKR